MAWYDTLADVVTKLASTDPGAAGDLIGHITSSNAMVAQVNALLLQVQRDPGSASQVATAIIGMRDVPEIVRTLAGGLPQASKDPSGLALQMLIAQIQSALPRSRWF